MRGRIWEDLETEIIAEFHQAHPLSDPTLLHGRVRDWREWRGWGVERLGSPGQPRPRARRTAVERMRDLREARKLAGLCRDCDEAPEDGRARCTGCLKANRNGVAEHRRKRGMREKLPETRTGLSRFEPSGAVMGAGDIKAVYIPARSSVPVDAHRVLEGAGAAGHRLALQRHERFLEDWLAQFTDALGSKGEI